MSDDEDAIYPGGLYEIVNRFENKRRPLTGAAEALPPADADLTALWRQIVPPPPQPFEDAPRYSAERKRLELQIQFEGQSEILLLHAQLVSLRRRSDPPEQAMPLFLRLWAEEGEQLAEVLKPRWLISAATTFADCGVTPVQRACGMGFSVLFDMIKLHDSERRLSGRAGDEPFPRRRKDKVGSLAFDLEGYSMRNGDLDLNLFARLWKLSESDLTIRPLGLKMLELAMTDPRTVFSRIQAIKKLNNQPDGA